MRSCCASWAKPKRAHLCPRAGWGFFTGSSRPASSVPARCPAVGLKNTIAMPKADRKAPGLMSGPIGWIQVLAGILIAVAGGSFATRPVRQFFINFSEGMLKVSSHEQDTVTLGEIFALSILF